MTKRMPLILTICSLLSFAVIGICQTPQEGIQQQSPINFDDNAAIRDFFASKSIEQLKVLKHNEDPSVAIYAAWYFLEDRRMYSNDKYMSEFDNVPLRAPIFQRKVDPSKIEFAGYLSGFLGLELPEWWRAALVDPDNNHFMLKSYGFVRTFNCYHHDRVVITKMDHNAIKGMLPFGNGQTFDVPWDLEQPQQDLEVLWYPNSIGGFDIVSSDDNRLFYVTAHKDMAVSRIYCSGKMGDVIWKNDSSESALPNGRVPFLHTLVEIRIVGKRVLLFSSSCCDTFLDIFDRETGKRIGGFSNKRAVNSADFELDDE